MTKMLRAERLVVGWLLAGNQGPDMGPKIKPHLKNYLWDEALDSDE